RLLSLIRAVGLRQVYGFRFIGHSSDRQQTSRRLRHSIAETAQSNRLDGRKTDQPRRSATARDRRRYAGWHADPRHQTLPDERLDGGIETGLARGSRKTQTRLSVGRRAFNPVSNSYRSICMKKILSIGLLFLVCQTASSRQADPKPGWDSLKFLLGKWVGEGTSEVGEGAGYFTFEASLNGKALVRKNHAEYPATKDRPKVVHEDLMIVYLDSATKQPRAFYTDSEGNVINYTV